MKPERPNKKGRQKRQPICVVLLLVFLVGRARLERATNGLKVLQTPKALKHKPFKFNGLQRQPKNHWQSIEVILAYFESFMSKLRQSFIRRQPLFFYCAAQFVWPARLRQHQHQRW